MKNYLSLIFAILIINSIVGQNIVNKVFFQKELDEALASQLLNINDHGWLDYNIENHFIIEEKIIEYGYKTIIGQLNLTAIEDNTILHSLDGNNFRRVGHED